MPQPITIRLITPGESEWIPVDYLGSSPMNISVGITIAGSATYTVEHTFQRPEDNPTRVFQHETLVNQTANADGNYAFPVAAVRINITAVVGSVTFDVTQAGKRGGFTDNTGAINFDPLFDAATVIYDQSDLTSMFVGTDGSGGNPSPNDPVGLVLDKSEIGNIPASQYIGGQPNFADDFTNSANWQTPTQGVTDNGDGTLTVTDVGGTNGILSFQSTNNVGDWVYLSVNITSATSTNMVFRERNSSGAGSPLGSSSFSGTGTFTVIQQAGYSNSRWAFQVVDAGNSATINSFEIKRIPGQHMTAPSDAARPVLGLTDGVYSLVFDGVTSLLEADFAGGAGPSDPASINFAIDTVDVAFVPFSRSAGQFVAYQNSAVTSTQGFGPPLPTILIDETSYGINPTRATIWSPTTTKDGYALPEYENSLIGAWPDFDFGGFPSGPINFTDGTLIGPSIVPNATDQLRSLATLWFLTKTGQI